MKLATIETQIREHINNNIGVFSLSTIDEPIVNDIADLMATLSS